ncbi:MAG: hypothetical protein ABJB47_04180 [Actinomycetota bacterium]
MSSWINFTALWQIIVVGILAGAGLPALFAVGVRALNMAGPNAQPVGPDSEKVYGGSATGATIAAVCFAVILAAIGYGIYLIVAGT